MHEESISQTELSKRLGITTRQVHQLTKNGPLGPLRSSGVRGLYMWPEARDAYLAFREDSEARRMRAGGRPTNAERITRVLDDFERSGLLEALLEGVSARLGVALR